MYKLWPPPPLLVLPPIALSLLLLLSLNGAKTGALPTFDDNTFKLIKGVPSATLPVPIPTYTFASYYTSPVFKPITPVYVSQVDVASYVPDTIVSTSSGQPLHCSGSHGCKVIAIYRSIRRANKYQKVMSKAKSIFTFKNGPPAALMIRLSNAKSLYKNLYANGKATYYDPNPGDAISPFGDQVKPAAQVRQYQKQIQWNSRRQQWLNQGWAKQLARERAYLKKKRLDPRLVTFDIIRQSIKEGVVKPRYSILLGGNFVAWSFIYDYAIIFVDGQGQLSRLDITIVPRVKRNRPTRYLLLHELAMYPSLWLALSRWWMINLF